MTRGPVGARGAVAIDSARWLDAGTILTILLVTGLALRVLLAGVLLPASGLGNDVGAFNAWAQRLASVGPAEFYEPGYFADYPPGYLYVLWVLGHLGGFLGTFIGQNATGGLVKVPAILADIGVAWLLFVICRRWGSQLVARVAAGSGPSGEVLGLLAATIYLFSPATIFTSAVWGQVDSVGALVMLAAIYVLARRWTEAAAVLATIALLVKFQYGFMVPLVAVVGLRRHLFGRSSDPEHDGRREPYRALTSLAAGLTTLVVLMAPFGMTLYAPLDGGNPHALFGILPEADPSRSLVGKFFEAAATYQGLTINALNPWRLPLTDATGPLPGLGDTLFRGDDALTLFTVGNVAVTAQLLGGLLFAIAVVLALWQVARRDDLRGILLASLLMAVAFFVLPTRVHERYLLPALALAAPLILRGRPWAFLYGALSAFVFLNVYWVYTADWSFVQEQVINPGIAGQPMPRDPLLAAFLFTDGGIYLLSAVAGILLAAVAWPSVRLALRPVDPSPTWVPDATVSPPLAADWEGVATTAEPAVPSPFWTRFTWLAPDPDDPYLRERGRRLDRLDAVLLVGLVLFALAFRLWRLDLPRGMHFDEVYHARSAMEWLANWEHGWDRDVYEWTHPMVAKYLIAAGIAVADPNRLVAEVDVEAPAPQLAIAPARESLGRDRSILFSAGTGTEVVARDALTGDELARWDAGGPAAALGYDDAGPRLLVGRTDTGTIATFDLTAFLASGGVRAPPAGVPLESGMTSVSQIVVPGSPSPILARGPDAVSSIDRITSQPLAVRELAAGGIAHLPAHGVDPEPVYPERLVATVPFEGTIVFLDVATLEPAGEGDDPQPVEVSVSLTGPLITRGSGDDQQVFALSGPLPANDEHPATQGGFTVIDGDRQAHVDNAPLPGTGLVIGWQPVANIVYVGGTDEASEPVLWAIEPHGEGRRDTSSGFAAFDATPLPGQPLALTFDVATTSTADDHGRLLASVATPEGGELAIVDAGSNAFAWRLAGVLFGALLVGLIYLLAATLFGRRRIAVLAAAFVAVDGMSYVMSRISMNDIFVAVFIVAAYLLFWQIWSGRWRRSAWWALPTVGVFIGLAAATKWVGFYALAGLLILVLARSPLGRLVLLAMLAFGAVVAGIGAPWPFLVVMLIGLALALVIVYQRPIRIDTDELRLALPATGVVLGVIGTAFALAYPTIDGRDPRGAVEYLFAMLARGAQAGWPVWIMIGVAGVLIAWRALASLRNPDSDARWYRPGEMAGFAWSWAGACLVIVPLVVYGLSYLPYLELGHTFAIADEGPGYGWSLDELHSQMFGYHFGLQAGHDSASPWWSWPLALKPTWFHISSFDSESVAVIYNGGNPILFWAGIPAVVGCAILAWKRRSLALALVVAAFAFQFLPWTRIERATFAYHYLTAVVFAMIAVAYFVDEALRHPLWRDLAVGYLALAAFVGLLIFPLGSALPMPDWYINAARALPPWNFEFQFPDPPPGERGELLTVDGLKLVVGGLATAVAVAFGVAGRGWLERRRDGPKVPEPLEG